MLRTLKRVLDIAYDRTDAPPKGNSPKLLMLQRAAYSAKHNYPEPLDFHTPKFTTYQIRTLMWTLLYDLTAGEHVWGRDSQRNKLVFTLDKLQQMMTGSMVVPHFFMPKMRETMAYVEDKERKFLYIIAGVLKVIFSARQ